MTVTTPPTAAEAWRTLQEGNARFVHGDLAHPRQDATRRAELSSGQRPFALVLGCSDSRVGPEVVFDQGLGDLFVVRTAGQVVDSSVLGSIEFGVAVLGIPLVVVLGHGSCGAVAATAEAVQDQAVPGGYVRDIVERVMPSVVTGRRTGAETVDDLVAEHVRHTGRLLRERSVVLADAVESGTCGVIGLFYSLADGRTHLVDGLGDLTG